MEIDSELSFTIHIDKLCKKLSQRIGVLNRIKACLPLTQRMAYYNAVIKPVMNYASVIWYLFSSKDNLNKVLGLQKRAARVILYASPCNVLNNTESVLTQLY